MEEKTRQYAEKLARMIREDTISDLFENAGKTFPNFHTLLRELFPGVFSVCTCEVIDGALLLCWKGRDSGKQPVLLMNHHDVVEAPGAWTHPPFAGEIHDEKLWGRGTLDTKGGLFCMLQAAEELIAEGYQPAQDVWFESSCTEETTGTSAQAAVAWLKSRGLHFDWILDEGGMIVYDPIGGADGTFAMVGVGEKGCADLKFIAESKGGHASAPGKNSPLVRLGKFMAACERLPLFKSEINPVTREMFHRLSPTMDKKLGKVLDNKAFDGILSQLLPSFSDTAGAMVKTTLAFTMAGGSEGTNVMPQEAWVVGNMRFSHHQGRKNSFHVVERLAKRYGIRMEILDGGVESPVSDFRSDAFGLVERAVSAVFPGVITAPYITNTASDARFFGSLSENCLRFVPFRISDEQLASIHGLDENVDLAALAPAVAFYKYMIRENENE